MLSVTDSVLSAYHWLLCRVDPEHPVSLTIRAEEALERHEWGITFDFSNAALKKRDDFAPALFLRAAARLRLDDHPGALHDLNRFLALAEEPPPLIYFWRGWIYVQRDEWALALADFDRVVAVAPNDAPLHYWRAYIFWQRDEWARMRDSLEEVERLAPGLPLAAALWGHLFRHEGRLAEAEGAYSRTLADEESSELRYNRAVVRRLLGQFEGARSDMAQLLQAEPHNPWAHHERCALALDEGEAALALAHAQRAVALAPGLVELHVAEVAALLAQEARAEALARLEAMRLNFPESAVVAQLHGDLLFDAEAMQEAAQSYRAALALEPHSAALRVSLAEALAACEEFDEAEALLDGVVVAGGEALRAALGARADLYRLTNRPDAMAADLAHLLAAEPDDGWALTYRAAYRHWQGDLAGAEADYDAAVRAASGEAWIWAFRGTFHQRFGRLAAARSDFQQAITLEPEDGWVRCQWAELLWESGHRSLAAEVLDCLVADEPDDGFARLARAEMALLLGEHACAVEDWETLILQEHEQAWLAHAALAALCGGEARALHLAQAERLRPAPSFWGASPALVLAQRALLAWLHGDEGAALAHLAEAEGARAPGEPLWRALAPLAAALGATALLAALALGPSSPAVPPMG